MRALLPLLVLGCSAEPSTDDPVTADPAADFAGAPLAPISDGDCPGVNRSGTKTFSSAGLDRDVVVHIPEDLPANPPLLYVFHGLGDSAESMSNWMALQTFADDNGMVVVLPDSKDRFGLTWSTFDDADITLFDDLRSCLARDLSIDLDRVYASGFSFGGLWTTHLTLARSTVLATSFVMSGGTSPFIIPYDTPERDLPVMLMWGGPTDTYGEGAEVVRFEDMSLAFSEELRDDGHYVAHCVHDGGHTVPLDIHDVLSRWLDAHTYGEASPFAGSFDGFPSYCAEP
jgi:poly(3-hydroxybutyrate) depolymerase